MWAPTPGEREADSRNQDAPAALPHLLLASSMCHESEERSRPPEGGRYEAEARGVVGLEEEWWRGSIGRTKTLCRGEATSEVDAIRCLESERKKEVGERKIKREGYNA